MEVLKKKPIAMLVMSLIIFIALVLTAKAPIGEAVIILFILLAVFTVIDFIVDAKCLTEKQARFASTVVGLIAVAGIVIWSTFAGPGAPVNSGKNTGQVNTPSPVAVDETYELGLFYFERGNYEEAIQTLKEVADGSGSYVEAQKLLAEATDCYRDGLMDTANTYVEKDDYKLAIDILNAGLLVIPDDAKLLQTIDDYSSAHMNAVRIAAIVDAEACAVERDYANALKTIQEAIDEVGSDAELTSLYNNYIAVFRKDALSQATLALQNASYDDAMQIIQSALEILPSDTELTSFAIECKTYAPVYLVEDIDYLTRTTSSFTTELVIENTTLIDCDGNSFGGHYNFHNNSTASWHPANITFDLTKEFKSFCGTIVLPEDYKHTSFSAFVYVYGDDRLIYQSPSITSGFHTENFVVDVSDVSTLKIEMVNDSHLAGGDWVVGYLTNAYLSRLSIGSK